MADEQAGADTTSTDPKAAAETARQARIDAQFSALEATPRTGGGTTTETKNETKVEAKARRAIAALDEADFTDLDEVAPAFGKKMRGFVKSITDALADRDGELDGVKGLKDLGDLKDLLGVKDDLRQIANERNKTLDRQAHKAFDALAKNGLGGIVGADRVSRMGDRGTLELCKDLYAKAAALRDRMDDEITLEEAIVAVGKRRFKEHFKDAAAEESKKAAIEAVEKTASIPPGRSSAAVQPSGKKAALGKIDRYLKAKKGE